MLRTLIFLALILSIAACSPSTESTGSQLSGDLQPGVAVSGSLEKDGNSSYKLQLDSGMFVFGYVDQISVDVIVELTDAENKTISKFDSPARGHENFQFTIDTSGEYTLNIKPFEEESGDFSVMIKRVEPVATDPAKRVDQLMVFYSDDQPGGAIGVMKDGRMIFSKAYGKANLTHDLDFELDMPTNIGSVSKQFTAMSVLLLEKQGKLSLEDDVRDHIPELPDLGQVVTVKNILNHTNGWREVYNMLPIRAWYGEDKLLKSEVLRMLQAQPALQAAPGEEYNYNNSAFIMAAEIVERVSGQDFPDFVRENIFSPLGMNNSYVRKDPQTVIPRATQGYSNGDDGIIESGDLDAAYGAGAIYTTPADLVKWMNNFESAAVGGPEVVEKLVTPGILNNGDTIEYGLGIGVREYRGIKIYAHGGADIAHRAMLMYFPALRSGVVALSNNATFNSGLIASQVADVFFEGQFNDPEPEEEEEEAADEGSAEVNEEILEKYAGKYKSEAIGMFIEYKLENGNLVAYPTGQPSIPLTPLSETTFSYFGIEASVEFKTDESGEYNIAIHTQGGRDITFGRIPPYDPGLDQLQEFTGKYFCEELETFYTIALKDSSLVARHYNLEDIELSPTEEDAFSGNAFFMGEVAFQRGANGNVTSFTVGNGRTKGVLFERTGQ